MAHLSIMKPTRRLAAALAGALSATLLLTDAASAQGHLELRFASFDPVVAAPEVPAALASTSRQRLFIVQFDGTPTQRGRDLIDAAGGEIVSYLPQDAYVVRVAADAAAAIEADAGVRWVGPYHPAYRLDPAIVGAGDLSPTRCRSQRGWPRCASRAMRHAALPPDGEITRQRADY